MKLRVLTIIEGLVRVKKSFKSCTLRFPMDENIFNIFLVDSRTVTWSWKNMPDTTQLGRKPGGNIKYIILARIPSLNV